MRGRFEWDRSGAKVSAAVNETTDQEHEGLEAYKSGAELFVAIGK